MLATPPMMGVFIGTLDSSPKGFHPIGVNCSINKRSSTMADDAMSPLHASIAMGLIGVDHRILCRLFMDASFLDRCNQ